MVPRPYRPALDGVRAFAVLGVMAYHVSGGKRGGFLGVDVFFVLSGYLITELLLSERMQTGRIVLREFWARRARRLLPALLVVVAVSAVVIHQIDATSTWTQRRGDLISTLLYVANWHFIATDQSYFAQYAGVSPMRHMWSLGIEEQFYIAWPLLLGGLATALRRRPQAIVPVILGGAVISAGVLTAAYDQANPSRAYFGTDTRAHELLLGAALAALVLVRPGALTGARARRLAAWAAPLFAVILLAAALRVSDETRAYYLGGSFVFAAAVAGLLWAIEARPRAPVALLLSIAPLRWVGRISYGLYLWHWPMIIWVPQTDRLATLAPRLLQLIEIGATFVLATLSFYLVEQPIRRGGAPWLRASRRRLAVVVPVAIAGVSAVAWQATSLNTAPAAARAVADTSDSECPRPRSPTFHNYAWCSRTAPKGPDAAVVATAGDSISRALDPGMRALAARRGWRYVQAGQGGCSIAPLLLPLDTKRANVAIARTCPASMPTLLRQVRDAYDPDVWIVADAVLRRPLLLDGRLLAPGNPRRRAPVRRALDSSLRLLTASGAHVVVIGSLAPAQPVECVTRTPAPADCSAIEHTPRSPAIVEVNRALRQAVRSADGHATFISIEDIMCPGGDTCPPLIAGRLARYDGEHFTGSFSRRIVPEIVARAERAGVRFTRRDS